MKVPVIVVFLFQETNILQNIASCRYTQQVSQDCYSGFLKENARDINSASLRLFCRMRNRSYVSKLKFTCLVNRSVTPSFLGSKLLFVFPLTNAQLDLTKRKMSSNGSANVKHSEAMSDEIITAMSTACGASIFLFELF